jgi:hypothetical protein
MKGLGNNKPSGEEKRVDFGEAIISNCRYDCEQCLLKAEGCHFVVNSIRCEAAHQRLKKILAEERDGVKETDDDADPDTIEDEENSMAEYLKNLPMEGEDDVDSE